MMFQKCPRAAVIAPSTRARMLVISVQVQAQPFPVHSPCARNRLMAPTATSIMPTATKITSITTLNFSISPTPSSTRPAIRLSIAPNCLQNNHDCHAHWPTSLRQQASLHLRLRISFTYHACATVNRNSVIWEFRHISVLATAPLQAQSEPERQAHHN